MGYGGIIKTVVRVAASVMGGIACGPPCAAIGSALATGATGGSFKEALMSGATSYIGGKISEGVTGAISEAGQASNIASRIGDGSAFASTVSDGSTVISDINGNILATGDLAAQATDPSMFTDALTSIGEATAPITTGISKFADTTFGMLPGNVNRTAYDLLGNIRGIAEKTLGELGFDLTPTPFDIVGTTVGGLAELTLNEALTMDLPEIDDILSQKWGPEQIAALKQEARNKLSQGAFDRMLGETVNPGVSDEEFRKILAAGIERENVALGEQVTEPEFRQVFDNPDLGRNILTGEEDLRRQAFGEQVAGTFPGGAFQPLDDSIIQSIVEERAAPARQQISNLAARGNLNPIGGQRANLFLSGQEEGATERVKEIGQSVLGGAQRDVDLLRGQAETGVSGYRLGDELFDIAPFAEQREKLITERQGSLGEDVRSAIGTEPIFDLGGALRTGSRAQGAVSGTTPNQSFLDAIAAREVASRRDKRGLGTRGSGAF